MHDEQTTMHPATKMLRRLSKCVLLALLLAGVSSISRAQSQKPLLLRDPAVSKSEVAFSYAGSILGGEPRRRQRSPLDQLRARGETFVLA